MSHVKVNKEKKLNTPRFHKLKRIVYHRFSAVDEIIKYLRLTPPQVRVLILYKILKLM